MQFEPTSERLHEESYRQSDASYIVYLFHIATYRFAQQYCQGRDVLDLGCGTGYGTHALAQVAATAIGVDVAADAVEHARSRYRTGTLSYELVDPAAKLPFADASFDVVTSFQVIEHVHDVAFYLQEAHRVLRPGGIFIVATPDRQDRLFPFQKPWNPWHLVEYSPQSLREAIVPIFGNANILRMGGEASFVGMEIARTRRIRLLSIPFTLPFVPDILRVPLLKFISRYRGENVAAGLTRDVAAFDEKDVDIAAALTSSVNLLAVARRDLRAN